MNKFLGSLLVFMAILLSSSLLIMNSADATLVGKNTKIVSGEGRVVPVIKKKDSIGVPINRGLIKTSTGNSIYKDPSVTRTGAKILVNPFKKMNGTGAKLPTKYQTGDYIEIFEFPDYQGRSTRFYKGTESSNNVLPFSSRNISVKMSNEATTIVFLRENSDDPKNSTLISNSGSIIIESENIDFIRVSTKAKLEVVFNGILYGTVNNNPTLRNNDAKRLYGNITYQLYGIEGFGRNSKKTPIVPVDGSANRDSTIPLFQKEKNTDYIAPFIYDTYTYALTSEHGSRRSADNVYGQKFLRTTADLPHARKVFYVDALSYSGTSGYTLQMAVDIKIGSAYKSCDICTDFTWDASMINTVNEKLFFPNNQEYVYDRTTRISGYLGITQLGPYRKNPSRQGIEKNFTGPQIPTYIQFTSKIID